MSHSPKSNFHTGLKNGTFQFSKEYILELEFNMLTIFNLHLEKWKNLPPKIFSTVKKACCNFTKCISPFVEVWKNGLIEKNSARLFCAFSNSIELGMKDQIVDLNHLGWILILGASMFFSIVRPEEIEYNHNYLPPLIIGPLQRTLLVWIKSGHWESVKLIFLLHNNEIQNITFSS